VADRRSIIYVRCVAPSLPAESGVSYDATRHLRDAIRAGRFGPGDRIVERLVAEELDISPIAVRDAFARLVQEGWIERVPRRGVRVPLLHPAEVEDILAARALVEGQAAALAAGRIATAGDADLRLVPPAMGRAARRQDVAALLTLDDAFHRALWTLGGSAAL
jgi:DNA-binding GntR family transcriptional regulator